MSVFLDNARRYKREFHLDWSGYALLLLHYPLFKIAWYAQFGKSYKARIAKALVRYWKSYVLKLNMLDASGLAITVPVSFVPADLESFREIFGGQEYKATFEADTIKSLVDLGANTGMASLYFLTQYPLTQAVLVEANPKLAKQLKIVFGNQINRCSFHIENSCIHQTSGQTLWFFVAEDHRHSGISNEFDRSANQIELRTLSIGDLLKKYSLSSIDLLKMDIEGAEHALIEKDPNAFKAFRHICAEIHGSKIERDDFAKKIMQLGFKILNRKQSLESCEILFATQLAFSDSSKRNA